MSVLHRPLDITTVPDEVRRAVGSEPSRFKAKWQQTLDMLQWEADDLEGNTYVGTARVLVEVDLPRSAFRNDGGIKAGARAPDSPLVAVTVPHRELGELRLVSGRYYGGWQSEHLLGWQANVRAVALTLKAMRDMARWGAATGQQYRGFAAIGATSTGTALGAGLTPDDALALLWRVAEQPGTPRKIGAGTIDGAEVAELYRKAARRAHPDSGGDPAVFASVGEARDVLLRAVGR